MGGRGTFGALVVIGSLVLARQAAAQLLTREVVALEGAIAPGGSQPYSYPFTAPSVGTDGTVVFHAWVSGLSGYESVIMAGGSASDLHRVVQSNWTIPSGPGRFYFTDYTPAVSRSGWIGFASSLYETAGGHGDDTGLFRVRTNGTGMGQLAREGRALSRGGWLGTFGSLQAATINNRGASAFMSRLSSSVWGLYVADGGTVREITRIGDVAPGMGRRFEAFTNPRLNDAGDVAFGANVGLTSGWMDSIFVSEGGSARVVAKQGMAAPTGGEFDSFITLSAPNEAGEVAFAASLDGSSTVEGVYLGGSRMNIGIAYPGLVLPNGGVLWSVGRQIDLNESGEVVFRGTWGAYQSGIFVGDGTSVRTVALDTQSAPGGGVFPDLSAAPVAINDAGQVLFLARVNLTVGTSEVLCLHDPQAGLLEIARTGDALAGSVITGLGIATNWGGASPEGRSLGARYRAAFRFDLQNGREGIAVVGPGPTAPPGAGWEASLHNALDRRVLRADGAAPGGASFSKVVGDYVGGLEDLRGLAADGVATIAAVFRAPQGGWVNVELSGGDGVNAGLGLLTAVDGTAAVGTPGGVQSIEVPTELVGDEHYAVVLLRAPAAYERAGAGDAARPYREVRLRVSQSGEETTLRVRVGRPPVVLVHGLWATGATWDPVDNLASAGYWVAKVDYATTNGHGFDVNDGIVSSQIWQYLDLYRDQTGLAAAQAIVVGHSMGGVLARRVVGGQSVECLSRSPLNRGEGTVDRLITVATPHHGSVAATLLVLADGTPIPGTSTLVGALEGCVTCGAVRDLRPDSVATQQLPDTRDDGVPTHAIIGTGGRGWVALGTLAGAAASEWGTLGRVAEVFGRLLSLYEEFVFADLEHDLVVDEASQRGGLPGSAVTGYGFAASPFLAGCHIGLPDEARVRSRLLELFAAPPEGPEFAAGFPPVPAPWGPGWSIPLFGGPGGLRLSGPAGTVMAGQSFNLGVESLGGFLAARSVLASRAGVQVIEGDGIATVVLAADVPVGPLVIRAMGTNAAGEAVVSDPITVNVAAPTALVGLRVEPAPMRLSDVATSGVIRVVGLYADGIEREIEFAAAGIAVTMSEGAAARLDAGVPGLVVAARAGVGRVRADYGGFNAEASVVVAPVRCPADLAEPWGILDPEDSEAFAELLAAGDVLADLASPVGVLDSGDETEFERLAGSGCSLRRACAADVDGSGSVDSTDFFEFLGAFFAGGVGADMDGSGGVDSSDFFGFLGAFFAGC